MMPFSNKLMTPSAYGLDCVWYMFLSTIAVALFSNTGYGYIIGDKMNMYILLTLILTIICVLLEKLLSRKMPICTKIAQKFPISIVGIYKNNKYNI